MSAKEKGDKATSVGGLTPPLKWHVDGGKHYLAKRIIELMPPRCKKPNAPEPGDDGWLHYVEPYAGGLSVLLANDPNGISEAVNDLNQQLTNFWQVIANEGAFSHFTRRVSAIPFSEAEYDKANPADGGPVGRAVAFFIRCRQSLAGRMDSFAPLSRNRVRSGMNEQASAWLTAVDGLPAIHERMKRVVVLNRDALDVIRQQDGPRTLYYLDPPYLHETRSAKDVYEHEMTPAEHLLLLHQLAEVKGKFLLSGYRSKMYDETAEICGWHRTDFDLPNNSASGDTKQRKTECVWTNYDPRAGK